MIETVLYCLIAPWILALITSVWMYPAALEEVVKWGLLRSGGYSGWYSGAIVGVAFGLSELGLFILNGWMSGDWGSVLTRAAITVPMHSLASAVSGYGLGKGKFGALLALMLAMGVHALFNYLVSIN